MRERERERETIEEGSKRTLTIGFLLGMEASKEESFSMNLLGKKQQQKEPKRLEGKPEEKEQQKGIIKQIWNLSFDLEHN